ncbi:FAM18B [Taphrina deformans PYCC 5710]|uniref:Golgi apparatus membrane protein TVP23 n=1 Tax=Taphrina deformans (strain PYCC 5710 / ATCC 11124 / CBS 356.35 / IMI 108563 / JCM 9778 / NBRC 8474) TaxID=1097556 RepID=R4X8L6_TAPDE|nr:FAM18B [Taphrina deformans PYCC 5710]|eukprot:CCG81700.1 FAM18B [Taphrina deformans PYCC 5710]
MSLPAPVQHTRTSEPESRHIFQLSSHPIALFFFLAFRLAAVLTYLLGLLFTSNFILIFVIIVLLLAFDFWTIKNVSGRLLVGLRWFSETGNDGSSIWVFESADSQNPINATDNRLFWGILYATPVVWLLLAFVAILKFEFVWLTLVIIAIVLNMANALAYTRCDKDAKMKFARSLGSSATSGLLSRVAGRYFSFW